MSKKEELICDNCGKDCEELVTRQGMIQVSFVEFVCRDCFFELEGIGFDEYSSVDYYGIDKESESE